MRRSGSQTPTTSKIIKNSLGWLTVAGEMIGVVDELVEFAESIRSRGFQHVMVCGMGGSSLCPEGAGAHVLAGSLDGPNCSCSIQPTRTSSQLQRTDRRGALPLYRRFKVGKHDRAERLLQVLVRRS